METFFTSDTHFGHANIIKYSNRPFGTIEEMDEALIENWNKVVGPRDTIYHLGDFSFREPDRYLKRLNGRYKHFIWGNHDRNQTKRSSLWSSSGPFSEIRIAGVPITLCHYGMRVWNCCHHGALQFYGHSHGGLPGNRQSLDVGVDSWDYRPVNLATIQQRLAQLPPLREVHHPKENSLEEGSMPLGDEDLPEFR